MDVKERSQLVRLLRLEMKQSMGDPWGNRDREDFNPDGDNVRLARPVMARRRYRSSRKRALASPPVNMRREGRKWGRHSYYDRPDADYIDPGR